LEIVTMTHSQGHGGDRSTGRALQNLRRESRRLGRMAQQLEMAADTRLARDCGSRRGDGVRLAQTGIWAVTVLAAVALATQSWPGILSMAPRGAAIATPAAAAAATAPGARPLPDDGGDVPALATAVSPLAPSATWPAITAPPQAIRALQPSSPIETARATPAAAPTGAKPTADEMLALGSVLTGVRPTSAGPGTHPTGVVFFDPRCPYCHAAWKDLADSNLDLLWLPVPALGKEDVGSSKVAAVLGNAAGGKDVLVNAFGDAPASATMTAELQARADENTAGFLTLARSWPQEIEGVPAFVIRGADGQVHIGSGWPPPPGLIATGN
jgi:hypothetical protein